MEKIHQDIYRQSHKRRVHIFSFLFFPFFPFFFSKVPIALSFRIVRIYNLEDHCTNIYIYRYICTSSSASPTSKKQPPCRTYIPTTKPPLPPPPHPFKSPKHQLRRRQEIIGSRCHDPCPRSLSNFAHSLALSLARVVCAGGL